MEPDKSDATLDEAKSVARGSGIALAGTFATRGLRFVNLWQLSSALDPIGFGLYASVTNTVTILSFLAPVGLNSGIIVYGSQARGADDQARLKGTLIASFGGALLGGLLVAAFFLFATLAWDPAGEDAALAAVMPWGAIGVAAWGLLMVTVGALRVARDSVGQTSVINVYLPLFITALCALGVVFPGGTAGALVGFGLAHALACAIGLAKVWRHYGGLLRDSSIHAHYELGTLFRYSIPQAFASLLFRVTQWADIVMLTALSSASEVGIYRIAASLALVASVPAAATQTIFNATAAEYLYLKKTDELDRLLKIVTRWQVVLSGLIFLVLQLGQGLIYLVFDDAYAAGGTSLMILLVGQLTYCVFAPTIAIISMAERSRLNLLNGVLAAGLTLALNYLFIPLWGAPGASVASSLTIILWSLWQVAQVRWIWGCWPMTLGSAVLLAAVLALGLGLHFAIAGWSPWLQAPVAAAAVSGYAFFAWRFGRTPDDEVVLGPLRKKLGRVVRRFSGRPR